MYLRELFPNIYSCGHPSEKTWGAHSYFVHTQDGNVMVDSPQYEEGLIEALEAAGGVGWIFISHHDDIGDACQFQNRFGSKIAIHAAEASAVGCPVDSPFVNITELSPQLIAIPTPGHSPGSSCLLFTQAPGFLFTGDHLMGTRQDAVLPAKFSWTHDWTQQLKSARGLLDHPFDVVLPAHHNLEIGYVVGAKDALRQWLEKKAKEVAPRT